MSLVIHSVQCTQSTVLSNTLLSQVCVLVWKLWAEHTFQGQGREWRASDSTGPACGSTGRHILLMTSSNMLVLATAVPQTCGCKDFYPSHSPDTYSPSAIWPSWWLLFTSFLKWKSPPHHSCTPTTSAQPHAHPLTGTIQYPNVFFSPGAGLKISLGPGKPMNFSAIQWIATTPSAIRFEQVLESQPPLQNCPSLLSSP